MSEQGSIGQRLRTGREERGITPEQAAYRSKIPLQFLYALESDDYHLLPDPAYLIRPLHEYARVLGMDPVPLEAEFQQSIRRPPSPSLAVIPPPEPASPIPWTQILWTLAAIAVLLPLVFIALSLVSKRAGEQGSAPTPAAPLVEQAAPPAAAPGGGTEGHPAAPGSGATGAPARPGQPALPASAGSAVRGPDPSAPPSAVAATAERAPRRLLLAATAFEPTWMRVRADGGEQREVLLQKGQTVRFGAERGFVVTVGNAGGIQLSLNGEALPSLGASGQVVRDLAIPLARTVPPPASPAAATSAQ
jgi:cytoskeletal protein RodZ